ncbi:GtrA family protein [Aliiroseovarius crassostreae]|uniref:GtrA family protein n=1 Tax=Aliiroseovarius crassostreae TaxID=154981 RepID=UPI0021FE8D1C|nr:GtrA family protein [Aliiroseovarius crassostreae]UWQ02423.1 GtrA family protein [Aliiroseovarius crassostreae]
MRSRLVPFVLVGGAGTATHFLTALLLANLTTLSGIFSNFGGFSAAVLISYFGHARLTFRTELDHQFHFPRFVLAAGCGLILSTALTWVIYDQLGWPFWQAMALVAVTVPVLTYLLLAGWVFVQKTHRGQDMWIGMGLSGLCGLVVLAYYWGQPLNHDIIWYLVATERWLDGTPLYSGLVEVNPPLNFYYTIPAVLLSRWGDLSLVNAQYVVFAIVFSASLTLCWTVISSKAVLSVPRRVLFQLLLAVALIVPAYGNLAQRDHLFVVLVMPWLLDQLPSGPNGRDRDNLWLALIAAMGVCLKPHFLILPILITLWQVARTGDWRRIFSAANWIFLAVGAFYLLYVAFIHPAYFTEIVPVAGQVYGAYGFAGAVVLHRVSRFAFLAIIGFSSGYIASRKSAAIGLFAVATLAGLVSYLAQWTGYFYQSIPFVTFFLLGMAWLIVSGGSNWIAVTTGVIIFAVATTMGVKRGLYKNPQAFHLAGVISGADRVNMLTTHVYLGPMTAYLAGADWASRYPAIWQVPAPVNKLERLDCDVQREECAALQAILDQTRDHVIDDLRGFQPDVLIVDKNSGYFDTPNFDWMAFFATNPAFDQIMTGYRLEAVSDRFDIWRLK